MKQNGKKTENEVKETKKEAAVMDEAAKEKFQQKLKDLLAFTKKEKEHVGIPGDQRLLCGHAVRGRAV